MIHELKSDSTSDDFVTACIIHESGKSSPKDLGQMQGTAYAMSSYKKSMKTSGHRQKQFQM